MDEERPALPGEIRRHLGRLLASAYAADPSAPSASERFADLLAQLTDALDASDAASRRDAAAFQAGLLTSTPALRRFALSLTHDPAAADDLVQDTLLRAWRSRAKFVPGTNLEAWLFTILRNAFYSIRRKQGREVSDSDGAHAERLTSSPEQGGHLDLQDLRTALEHLPASQREALLLVTVEDLSYEEAAAVMGCQIGTVKSRVWRAREQLARMLGYDGAEVGSDGVVLSAMSGQS
ncbi:sigma-70 family RNA polymerase sigma factor [Methylobacterium sp. NEAU 140]|nr:sigma-70 family RNA polymerase sigma factor [Methylobacterium sp. NEAU 140]MDP4026967.1 sigma-70 family RNA polymerase sigma factor [Methylobacterium sp. NEAU 140]